MRKRINQYGSIEVQLPHGSEISDEKVAEIEGMTLQFARKISRKLDGVPKCDRVPFGFGVKTDHTIVAGEHSAYFSQFGLPYDIIGKTAELTVDWGDKKQVFRTEILDYQIVRGYFIELRVRRRQTNGYWFSKIWLFLTGSLNGHIGTDSQHRDETGKVWTSTPWTECEIKVVE